MLAFHPERHDSTSPTPSNTGQPCAEQRQKRSHLAKSEAAFFQQLRSRSPQNWPKLRSRSATCIPAPASGATFQPLARHSFKIGDLVEFLIVNDKDVWQGKVRAQVSGNWALPTISNNQFLAVPEAEASNNGLWLPEGPHRGSLASFKPPSVWRTSPISATTLAQDFASTARVLT